MILKIPKFVAPMVLTGVALATTVTVAATAQATPGADHKGEICHPVEGNGETGTGWVIESPDKASSHIDEALYPDGHYWKHETRDGRHDEYAVDGVCPGGEEPSSSTTTSSTTTSPTSTSHTDPMPSTSTDTGTTTSSTTSSTSSTTPPEETSSTTSSSSTSSTTTSSSPTSSETTKPVPDDLPKTRTEVVTDSFCDKASGLIYTVKHTSTYEEVWEESPADSGVWVLVDEVLINDAWEYLPGEKCAKDKPTKTHVVPGFPVATSKPAPPAAAPVPPALRAAPSAAPVAELAHTGVNTVGWVFTGIAALAAGFALYIAANVSRRKH